MYHFVTPVRNIISLRHSFFAFIATLSIVGPLSIATADSVDNPVLLTIHGNINDTENGPIQFDIEKLAALDPTSITSNAPWVAGPTQYTGVRVNALLESIGATSNQFEAIAVNDYKFKLTDIDFDKYPIIIAYKKEGEFFDLRELGPLMIVFPFDDFPELLTERNKAASVWQVIELRLL